MSISYKDIENANNTIKMLDIKGKNYAEVNQRIKAFRMVFPEGKILTQMMSNENGVCIFKAFIYADGLQLLATGHAYEKEDSTFINKTSYIENCETSAIGRALGMCGFGVDTSIASAEEVSNAQAEQTAEEKKAEKKATPKQIEFLLSKYQGENLTKLLQTNNIEKIEDLPMSKASDLISKIKGGK